MGIISSKRYLFFVVLVIFLQSRRCCSQSVPESSPPPNHLAHAVTGGPYTAYAAAGQSAQVTLDGSNSHSHFFDADTGVVGKIVTYTWETAEYTSANADDTKTALTKICSEMKCTVPFPHGFHQLKLTVTDNTNSSAQSTSSVTVKNLETPGVRAWYYASNGSGDLSKTEKALYSADVSSVDVNALPSTLVGKKTQVVYFGGLQIPSSGTYTFRVKCGGSPNGGYCYANVGPSSAAPAQGPTGGESAAVELEKGVADLYVSVLSNSASKDDFVTLEWKTSSQAYSSVPVEAYVHYPAKFAPVINSVSPTTVSPGTPITLKGTGFSAAGLTVAVDLEGTLCASLSVVSDTEASCVIPDTKDSTVSITADSNLGQSNTYVLSMTAGATSGIGYFQEPSFSQTIFTDAREGDSGKAFQINQAASMALGPDGRYYIGSLNGYVHVIAADAQYKVTSYCVSEHLGNEQSILGIGFNPTDFSAVKLYASVSILYWNEKHGISKSTGWRNGRIVMMIPGSNSCLKVEKTVIENLPVSNHDHGVNMIQFDNQGNLLVTAGGSTNGGRSLPSDLIGGAPDSPLSGAMLIAPVNQPGFNGVVEYDNPNDPANTKVISGDVSVFSSGLRNCFAFVFHSNGYVYGVDQGPNEGFGDFSDGCGANQTRPGKHDGDPLRLIVKGGFNGYANMNRGRFDPRQCIQRELASPADSGYSPPLTWFESSTAGLAEYTSNTFGGPMRGNLIASKFAIQGTGKAFRVILSADGKSVESKYEIAQYSDIGATMTPYGGIAMPRVWQGQIAVLSANEKNPGILTVSAVTPYRGPQKGGNRIMVTGWNFEAPLTATVGGKDCGDVADISSDGRSFWCTAPQGSGKVPVVVTSGGKTSKSWGWEYSYLDV